MPRIASIADALEISDEARVITLAGPPFKIVHTNRAWHNVTGYKFTEVANQTSAFLQGPDTARADERELVHALRQGQQTRMRLLNYTKSGEPFLNTLECFPLHDASGNLTHYCGVIWAEPAGDRFAPRLTPPPLLLPAEVSSGASDEEDGISRRPTREAPRQRPKRQRGERMRIADALNNTSDAVVMTQPHPPYNITHVNEPWCVMCGYTQEEVEGQPNSILQGAETDREILHDLMTSVERGEPTSATLVNYKKGGVKFVNQVTVQPVYNDEDELEQFMAMLHEV